MLYLPRVSYGPVFLHRYPAVGESGTQIPPDTARMVDNGSPTLTSLGAGSHVLAG